MATDSDGDLYERFVALLATPEGRNAYEAARLRFEGGRARLTGRADLLFRLADSCHALAFGSAPPAIDEQSDAPDLIGRLAKKGAWGPIAEVAWVRALQSGDAGALLETAKEYPETRDFLQPVLDGLLREGEASAAAEGADAEELIRRLLARAQRLDASCLDEKELRSIMDCVDRLMEVAKANELRERGIKLQRDQLGAWKARHQPHSVAPKVEDIVVVLEDHIERGVLTSADVDKILGLLEQLVSVDARHREAREDVERALREGSPLGEAANIADSTGGELEELVAAISDQFPPAVSSGQRQETSYPDGPDGLRAEDLDTERVEAVRPAARVAPEEPESGRPQDDSALAAGARSKDTDGLGVDPGSVVVHAAEVAPTTGTDSEGSTTTKTDVEPSEDGCDSGGSTRVEDDDEVQATADDHVATALNSGRFGLAYHLAVSSPEGRLSANLVVLVASNYATDDLAQFGAEIHGIADRLLADTSVHATGNGWTESRDFTVLAVCAALDPALVAPGGPAGQLLGKLAPRLAESPSLRSLAKTASDVSMTGVHLPRSLLRGDADDSNWQEAVERLSSETASWLAGERRTNLRFRAATKLWRRLLEDWGSDAGRVSLGRMFRSVDPSADKVDTDRLSQAAEYWRANRDKELDRVDRELRGSEALSKIEGSARTALRAKVDQALGIAERWVSLIGERPTIQSPFHADQARRLREAVDKHLTRALDEAGETAVEAGSAALLRRYGSLFDDVAEPPTQSIALTEILHGDLLANPDIGFDNDGRLNETPLPADALRSLLETTPDFAGAAVDRASRGDFTNAAATVDFAERTGWIDLDQADRARNSIDEHRERLQRTLAERLKETRIRLDAAYANGSLTLDSHEEENGKISDLDPDDGSFVRQLEILKEVDHAIESAKNSRRDAIRRRIVGLTLSQDAKHRIDSVVDAGQLQIAEDFLERLEQGEDLPAVEAQSDLPFDRFFPSFVEEFSAIEHRDEDGIGHVRQAIEERKPTGVIDAGALTEDLLRDGIALLNAWVALRDGPTSTRLLQPLMAALGFERAVVRGSRPATARTPSGQAVFELNAAPISDRNTARLPDFGSRANGNYRLMTLRGRVTAEAVIREVGEGPASGGLPNIVVFVGVLDVEARRTLAQDFGSGEYHATLVLDEALIAFLSSWPGSRLAAFFDCASAFAFSQPYDPDAPVLAPEMF